MTAVYMLMGVGVGAAVVLVVLALRRRPDDELVRRLAAEAHTQQLAELDKIVGQLRDAFGSLSQEALRKSSEQFLQLAGTRLEQQTRSGEQSLEEKKKLIDTSLAQMTARLTEVHATVQRADTDRKVSHESLTVRLADAARVTESLRDVTGQLRQALSSTSRRGQWGQRMAEDVLRLAGFIEHVNYVKQETLESGGRPDFVFWLPHELRVNMDVKFPLDNYLRHLEATDEGQAASFRDAFLRDVRGHVNALSSREYIDPAAGTVDYVLLFIPNEQLYAFIHEHDNTLLDDAIRKRVILCSPLTLYAVLAVIRQAVDTFRLERASDEILRLLVEFRKQWDKYVEAADKVGKRLDDAVKAYQDMATTRTRTLQRQIDKIDLLREQRALPDEAGASPADENVG